MLTFLCNSAYLPSHTQSALAPDLASFGTLVLQPKVLEWVADAEAHPPTVHSWDVWGRRKDKLVTSEGWRNLQKLGISEGMVAIAYENKYGECSRLYQFLKYHLWTGSCANVTCPSAMTDGAAKLLLTHANSACASAQEKRVFEAAYSRLISRESRDAWTSGQWMTERIGGSDVANTETLATLLPTAGSTVTHQYGTEFSGAPLGSWSISGFKWFSSATDANMAVLLAKTSQREISAIYVPMRRTCTVMGSPSFSEAIQDSSQLHEQITELREPHSEQQAAGTESNGISIQRLKSKLGTRPLPTAELVLENARGYLLGKQGRGIKEMSTILNITRVHNAVTACGLWGRGLAISRAFTRVRSAGGESLTEVAAHMRSLSDNHINYRAYMYFAFFVVALLGVTEQTPDLKSEGDRGESASSNHVPKIVPRQPTADRLLRLLTPVLKALSAKAAIAGLSECMESLGGVGYLDSTSPLDIGTNIARLFRDANVLSIWEGTTDIMGADTVRVLKSGMGETTLRALDSWLSLEMTDPLKHHEISRITQTVRDAWRDFQRAIHHCGEDVLKARSRAVMEQLGWIICSALLIIDAEKSEDGTSLEIAQRWVCQRMFRGMKGSPTLEVDKAIVFGTQETPTTRSEKL